MSIASGADLEWHDSSSVGAVRYLGYPLYSSKAQLNHFLDGVKVKVSRHANILRERHLSIRGAGLVANSLLLSKVWHLLRVVPVPDVWLKEIQQIVRKYLLPFWPTPSWSTLCLRRKHGGVGVVDIHAATRQHMLRSATRWHELGEHNNKYFYRIIKERQSQQTIQSLRCSSTGECLGVDAAVILRVYRCFLPTGVHP